MRKVESTRYNNVPGIYLYASFVLVELVGRKCRFFQWRDDEICARGKVLIPQQRQRIITLEAEVASCKRREKFLVMIVALLMLIDKDPSKAISLFWSAINAEDGVDSALKDMAIVMKQLDRSDKVIEAIKSFRHLCPYDSQESLDNVLVELYK
ncbi:protein pollenless 3, partial [Quercus suber]